MTVEFTLPDIGEGLHEAEVVNWLVSVGDTVARNQPFVEIMTDKSTVEMPAPAAGTVSALGVAEGEMIQVGELLVVIEDEDDAPRSNGDSVDPASTSAPDSMVGSERGDAVRNRHPSATPAVESQPMRRPKASPSTRRLASELGVDLKVLAGTGPGGRILADDVHAATTGHGVHTPSHGVHTPGRAAETAGVGESTPGTGFTATGPSVAGLGTAASTGVPGAAAGTSTPSGRPVPETAVLSPGVHGLRGVRRATAKAMQQSWSTIPHISAMNEINAEHLLSTRAQLRSLQEPGAANITPLVIALLAVARSLHAHPIMNATLDIEAETITVHERINIGVAVATDYGLMVPIIADADRLGVTEMAAELQRLTTAARDRRIAPEDLRGGTYTVTNFGSHGTHVANPIIRPGETGICGLGSIAERPMAIEGQVVARPTLPVVVCGDHRLVDGDVLASFHGHICRSLQAPVGLLL